MAGLDALRTLLRLQSPSNVRTLSQPALDAAADPEAAALAPTDLELKNMQVEAGQPQGGYGFTPSREYLGSQAMQAIKRKLVTDRSAEQTQLQQRLAPEVVKGEYGVRQAEASSRALADRMAVQNEAVAGRQEASQQAAMDRLNTQLQGRTELQQSAQDYKTEHPSASNRTAIPQQLYKMVQDAQKNMPGNPVTKLFRGNAANAQLESALTGLLDRKGTLAEVQQTIPVLQQAPGASIDEKIVNSGVPGLQQLDPYERQYLGLKLGL